jgi:hypothetical protein
MSLPTSLFRIEVVQSASFEARLREFIGRPATQEYAGALVRLRSEVRQHVARGGSIPSNFWACFYAIFDQIPGAKDLRGER